MDYFIDLVVVGISIGMVYGLVALGISFIYSGLDIVHFAHGEKVGASLHALGDRAAAKAIGDVEDLPARGPL